MSGTLAKGSRTVKFRNFGEYAIEIKVHAYIGTTDFGEYLEIAEELNMAIQEIVCDPADSFWHDDDVSIACTATDDGVGLENPANASFTLSTNVAEGIETDNASTDTRVICDANDNCAMAGPVLGNKVDKKAPVINIVQPGPSQYTHSETLVLDYSVTDGGYGELINEVQAQGGKSITSTAADILIADAEYLIAHCSDR